MCYIVPRAVMPAAHLPFGKSQKEVIWSVIPAILLGIVFYWGYKGWLKATVVADNAMEIRVTGSKWKWDFDYQRQGVMGVTGEMYVPVNKPVKLLMSSKDVNHSFYVPALRVKRDVVAGHYTVLGFTPTVKGKFLIECAEFCGDSHSRMLGHLHVVNDDEFQA